MSWYWRCLALQGIEARPRPLQTIDCEINCEEDHHTGMPAARVIEMELVGFALAQIKPWRML